MCTKYTWKWDISACLGAQILQGILSVACGTCALNPCESEIFQQQLVPKYFREYCSAFGVTHAINTHKKGIFRSLLVPKYFGEYWFAFGILWAANTHENGIFRQLLVPKYFGEYCFAFGVTCALNRHENGIFRQVSLPKYSREYCLWLVEHVHWIHVKVKYFGGSWCRYISENIVLPSV